jgi:hypothetical protein
MHRLPRVLALLPVLAWSSSHAGVHWVCGLSEDATQLVCLADAGLADEAARDAPTPTTAVVNGTRFPLDARRLYTVNLWSPATDPAHVDQLARATICYRSPGCSVSLSPAHLRRTPPPAAPKAR